MAKNKKSSFVVTISKLMAVVPLFLNFWKHGASLIEKETQQAKKNIVLIVTFFLIFCVLTASAWMSLLGLLFLYLISLNVSSPLALLLIFLLNSLLLILTWILVLNVKKDLFFPHLRKVLLKFKK